MKKFFVGFIMLFSLILTGCSVNREVILVRAGGPEFNHGSTYVINSTVELKNYILGTYNNFENSVTKYNDEYFETSALVIVEITKNTGSAKLTIKSVNLVNDSLIIKFKTKTPNVVTCDMAYWHILIECTQEEANTIKTIEVYDSGNLITKND